MVNIIHQLLVLTFIYNSNDFVMLFQIVSADCLIDGSATVQGIDNKISQLFFFLVMMQTRRFTFCPKIK